jgi:hypothetical protein
MLPNVIFKILPVLFIVGFVAMKMVNWLWKKGGSKDAKEEEEVDEEELKKKGFNPEGLEVEEVKDSEFFNYDKDFQEFIAPTPEEAQQVVAAFKYRPHN